LSQNAYLNDTFYLDEPDSSEICRNYLSSTGINLVELLIKPYFANNTELDQMLEFNEKTIFF